MPFGWVAAGAAVVNTVSNLNRGGGGSPSGQSRVATEQDIAAQKQALEQSKNLFDYHVENYRPLEQAAIQQAQEAGTPEKQEQMAAEAGATVDKSFTNARDARLRAQANLGSKPDSLAAQEQDRQDAIAKAGSVAGAENLARQNERSYGLSAKTAVADVGRNITSNAIGAENAAANAGAAASRGAATSADLNNQMFSNIGAAAGAVGNMVNRPAKPAANPYGFGSTPGDDVSSTEYGDPNAGDTTTDAYYGSDAAFRKGGLAKPPRHPHGGRVTGPGTGTSDSVPVMIDGKEPGALSSGEYVINAKAAKKHGIKKLDEINAKGLPAGHVMKNGTPVKRSMGARSLPRPQYQGAENA